MAHYCINCPRCRGGCCICRRCACTEEQLKELFQPFVAPQTPLENFVLPEEGLPKADTD